MFKGPFDSQFSAPPFVHNNRGNLAEKKEILPNTLPEEAKKENSILFFDAPKNIASGKASNYNLQEFGNSPILRSSKESHYKEQLAEEKKQIEKLLNSNNLEAITDFLLDDDEKHPAFQLEVTRVKSEYGAELAKATFLTNKDWKVFAAMEMYHKDTFKHQMRSMLEIIDSLENLPNLSKKINGEGIFIEQLSRAGGLHDFGKLGIPKFILDFNVKDEEWTYHFMNLPFLKQQEIFERRFSATSFSSYELLQLVNDHEKLHEFFEQNNFYAVSEVPIETVLNEEQKEVLKTRNIDSSQSLIKIMQRHEKDSEIYLKKLGYEVEALIAGNHHGYRPEESEIYKFPISQTTMQFIVELFSDILRFHDVKDALSDPNRKYLSEKSFAEIMAITIKHKYKDISSAATIANYQLKKYIRNPENILKLLAEPEMVKKINEFLKEHLPKEEKSYLPQ